MNLWKKEISVKNIVIIKAPPVGISELLYNVVRISIGTVLSWNKPGRDNYRLLNDNNNLLVFWCWRINRFR